ncbi:MAG TPA: tellurite resistance TerB family protein [Leucothrix sp.]|nr:tellurite resistance TerB family protein [Leucothrix sp.]
MSLMSTLAKVAVGIAVSKGLGKMMGGSSGGSGSGGGLGGLLGGLMGGGSADSKNAKGGLGGILDSLGGSKLGEAQSQGRNQSDFGGLFDNALQGKEVSASSEQEQQAEIMLRAMINAAKSDGNITEDEQRKITEHLGDISAEEAAFVRKEINEPLDTQGFIQSIPRGMEQQVYLMSLMAIDLDSNEEAHYLDQLAKGLNISKDVCNQIHEKVGAPAIYA